MPNMSYCRFQNTVSDLDDCLEHIHDDVSEEEHNARQRLIEIARQIVDEANGNETLMQDHEDSEDEDSEG